MGVVENPRIAVGAMARDEDPRRLVVAREALINDPEFLKAIVEATVQRVLDWEMTQHLQAGPHERTDARRGHRNGYKPRTLRTRVGTLELRVPQGTARGPSRPRCSIATSAARRRWWWA